MATYRNYKDGGKYELAPDQYKIKERMESVLDDNGAGFSYKTYSLVLTDERLIRGGYNAILQGLMMAYQGDDFWDMESFFMKYPKLTKKIERWTDEIYRKNLRIQVFKEIPEKKISFSEQVMIWTEEGKALFKKREDELETKAILQNKRRTVEEATEALQRKVGYIKNYRKRKNDPLGLFIR